MNLYKYTQLLLKLEAKHEVKLVPYNVQLNPLKIITPLKLSPEHLQNESSLIRCLGLAVLRWNPLVFSSNRHHIYVTCITHMMHWY